MMKFVFWIILYITTFLLHSLGQGFVYNFVTAFVMIPLLIRSIVLNGTLAIDWGFVLGLVTLSGLFMLGLAKASGVISDGIAKFGVDKEKTRAVYGAYIAMLIISVVILVPLYRGGDPYAGMRSVDNSF